MPKLKILMTSAQTHQLLSNRQQFRSAKHKSNICIRIHGEPGGKVDTKIRISYFDKYSTEFDPKIFYFTLSREYLSIKHLLTNIYFWFRLLNLKEYRKQARLANKSPWVPPLNIILSTRCTFEGLALHWLQCG